jgi:3-methyladenine DNA glycosylase AlkD
MNLIHGQILAQIQKVSTDSASPANLPDNYAGNKHPKYHLNATQRKDIVSSVLSSNKKATEEDLLEAVNSLYKGKSSDEKYCAGTILNKKKGVRNLVKPEDIDSWLYELEGWAEIDSLCQSNFGPGKYLDNWKVWSEFLVQLSKDRNIAKRRASLVLLVKPVRNSDEQVLADLAFDNMNRLKHERAILITKAVSWLLRSMIKNFRDDVESYLVRNQKSLPAIAVRETRSKLITGRK